VWSGRATPVTEIGFSLIAGDEVTFETANLSPGSDPILHLLWEGEEVDFDDNSGPGPAARLTYFPWETGSYLLVMRAASNDTAGTADVLRDGVRVATGRRFGGWQVTMDNLRQDEEIWTVKLPTGAFRHTLYLLQPGSESISARQVGGGTDGAARYVIPSLLPFQEIIVGVKVEQPVRLLRNDARLPLQDDDGDGLGDELEAALGTCPLRAGTVQGFSCLNVRDPRDTDGDGISDGWEVLGRSDLMPHQPLPMWGADPRHKDMFVEVDFRQDTPDERSLRLPPSEAREFARIFADRVITYSAAEQAAHVNVLGNPDGRPGISAHLDTGVNPQATAVGGPSAGTSVGSKKFMLRSTRDLTLYGNWGGYTSVPPIKLPDGSYKPVAAETVWMTAMSPARRGIFHYAMTYSGDSGQTRRTGFPFFDPWVATNSDGRIHAHEAGHHLGLGHSGPWNPPIDVNCNPNYLSIMNYAFQNDERFGYSHGDIPGSLNNAELQERHAVAPEPPPRKTTGGPGGISGRDLEAIRHLDVLQDVYGYWVDRTEGHVDWNRDGVFQVEGSPVGAYANYHPGGECEYTKYNEGPVYGPVVGGYWFPTLISTRAPALLRLGEQVYVFAEGDDQLDYRSTTSNLFCPPSKDKACARWTGGGFLVVDSKEGVDAVNILPDLGLVVTNGSDGTLRSSILDARGPTVQWRGSPTVIPGSVRAGGEPSMAAMGTCDVYLAYRGLDDRLIRIQRWTCGAGWSAARLAVDEDGNTLGKTPYYASPGIGVAYLEWGDGRTLYGAFPDKYGMVELWGYDPATRRWMKTNVMEKTRKRDPKTGDVDDEPLGPIEGRPVMAWTSRSSVVDSPGRLYLLAVAHRVGVGRGQVLMRMSFVSVGSVLGRLVRTEKLGLEASYQNSSYHAYGVDLLFDRGRDSNLRAAVTRWTGEKEHHREVWFRPYSDGILDYTYADSDDWATMRYVLCQRVVNPGGLVSNPIGC